MDHNIYNIDWDSIYDETDFLISDSNPDFLTCPNCDAQLDIPTHLDQTTICDECDKVWKFEFTLIEATIDDEN